MLPAPHPHFHLSYNFSSLSPEKLIYLFYIILAEFWFEVSLWTLPSCGMVLHCDHPSCFAICRCSSFKTMCFHRGLTTVFDWFFLQTSFFPVLNASSKFCFSFQFPSSQQKTIQFPVWTLSEMDRSFLSKPLSSLTPCTFATCTGTVSTLFFLKL